jgi:hypothetical protein
METIKQITENYLTENQLKTFKKLSLNSVKNADKINKLIKVAKNKKVKEQVKAQKDKIKELKLNSYDDYRGLFNVYNHIKKALKASPETKQEAKILTQKFQVVNVLSLIDFNDLVSIKNSGFNYGTKKHFNVLADALIEYINLPEPIQEQKNGLSTKVNELLTNGEKFDMWELFDLVAIDDQKIKKATAKFAYENDSEFFDKLNLKMVYCHEYEQGLKKARKERGQIGAAEFIEQWEAKQKAPKIKKVATADAAQLNA